MITEHAALRREVREVDRERAAENDARRVPYRRFLALKSGIETLVPVCTRCGYMWGGSNVFNVNQCRHHPEE